MGQIPFYLYFSLAFLEGLSTFYFVCSLTKFNGQRKDMLIFSVTYPLLTFALRKLPVSFGIHTLLLICLIAGLLSYYYKVKLSTALFSMILVFVIMATTEFVTAILFTQVFMINLNEILRNPFFWFLTGLPHVAILALFGYIIKKMGR